MEDAIVLSFIKTKCNPDYLTKTKTYLWHIKLKYQTRRPVVQLIFEKYNATISQAVTKVPLKVNRGEECKQIIFIDNEYKYRHKIEAEESRN